LIEFFPNVKIRDAIVSQAQDFAQAVVITTFGSDD